MFTLNLCDYGLEICFYSTVLVNSFLNHHGVLKNIKCNGKYDNVLFYFVVLEENCLCRWRDC